MKSYYCTIPMRLAALPVGPSRSTLGLSGLSPGFLKILSAHCEIVKIKKLLPTPPPPRINVNQYTFNILM